MKMKHNIDTYKIKIMMKIVMVSFDVFKTCNTWLLLLRRVCILLPVTIRSRLVWIHKRLACAFLCTTVLAKNTMYYGYLSWKYCMQFQLDLSFYRERQCSGKRIPTPLLLLWWTPYLVRSGWCSACFWLAGGNWVGLPLKKQYTVVYIATAWAKVK